MSVVFHRTRSYSVAMSELEFRYLGDFEVLRDGQAVSLPPSRKTRALLAYLSLNRRHFRRDYLCELLWEIPDDPRGSLRWSLSKLRRIVDDEDHKRIIADRTNVEFDASDVAIDVADLISLVEGGLASASTGQLEQAAERFQGNFLEGLELSNFHDFHAWCVAERERVLRAQADLLRETARRHAQDPGKALPYARRLVAISPYDESARAALIRMLVRLHHADEAEQQYRLGVNMLEEVGAETTGELLAAWREKPGAMPQPAAPVPAAKTSGKRPGSARPPGDIVGRDAELNRLVTIFAEVRDRSKAHCVLVEGDPGIGKSRLMAKATVYAQRSEAFLLCAQAYESESLRPFALWMDALRTRDPDGAADIFADKDADNRDRLFDGLSEMLANEAQDGPVILIFDSVHWCDESSSAALHYVIRMNRERPLLVLIAGRGSEMRDNVPLQQALRGLRQGGFLTEMALGPLAPEAVMALIEHNAPGADAARLSRECGGNPLLALELARAELEGDSGSSLNDLVRERLSRFDVDSAEVLRWAAVLSPHIDIDRLVTLTRQDADRVGSVLELAEQQAMLVATETGLRFSHDLVARGVYNEISPLRRQVMHRRVATMLEENIALDLSHAADLAHHATQSGDTGLAARAMVSAGRLCLRFFANDEAMNLARKGMQLAEALPDAQRVCVCIDLHDIMLSAAPLKDWEASAREYAALAEQAVDHGELAHARLGYHLAAWVRWEHGQWSAAREQSLQSARVVRGGRVRDQIVGIAQTAKCLVLLERDLPQADAMLMEAQALAENQHFHHHAIPAGAGMLKFHQNELDEAEELLKEARTLCKTEGDRVSEYQVNEYLAMIDYERGRIDEACERCAELVELGKKLRHGSEEPHAHTMAGLCQYAREDNDEPLDEALAALRVADAKHRLAFALNRAAQLDYERNRPDKAIARASEALEYATLLNRRSEMLVAHAVLKQALAMQGDSGSAARHASAIEELTATGVAEWAKAHAATAGISKTD